MKDSTMKVSCILVLVCLMGALTGCGGADERQAAYLEKARHSLEIGDLDKARINLKNVLQIDPNNAKAHFQLGRIHEQKKEYTKAFANYSKASELDVDNPEYHAKIGQFHLVLAGDIENAILKRDIILRKDPDNIHGLMLNAGILHKQNKSDEAKIISKKIFSMYPENVENAAFLSRLYSAEKQYDEAINTLQSSINKNKDSEGLNSLLANTLYAANRYDDAESVLKNALNSHPDILGNYTNLARFYQQIGKSSDAESILRKAINEDLDDVKRKLYLIEFLKQYRSMTAALDETISLINQNPDVGELRIVLGKLYLSEKNMEKARSTFEAAISDFPEDSTGVVSRVHLAAIFTAQGDIEDAVSIIDEASSISPNDPAVNLLKAKIDLSKNDVESAIISLRIVIKNEPGNIEAYTLLASAHKANKELAQSNEVLNQAYVNNRSNGSALLELSKYHVKSQNFDQAEKVIDALLAIDWNNYEALTIKSTILTGKKEFTDAQPYIKQLLTAHPDKENGYIQSAISLVADNKTADAEALLIKGYELTGKNRKILYALTNLQLSRKEFNEPIKRIREELSGDEKDLGLYVMMAGVYIASERNADAEMSLKSAIKANPKVNQPYVLLSRFYVNTNKKNQAVNILKDGLSNINGDAALTMNLGGLYEQENDYESSIKLYERSLESNKDNALMVNNLAMLLVENRNDENSLNKAKLLADKLRTINQPVMLDTAGWVYYKNGNYSEAVTILKDVVESSPESAVFNYHLGMAMYMSGNKKSAKDHLSKALSNNEQFNGRDNAEAIMKKL